MRWRRGPELTEAVVGWRRAGRLRLVIGGRRERQPRPARNLGHAAAELVERRRRLVAPLAVAVDVHHRVEDARLDALQVAREVHRQVDNGEDLRLDHAQRLRPAGDALLDHEHLRRVRALGDRLDVDDVGAAAVVRRHQRRLPCTVDARFGERLVPLDWRWQEPMKLAIGQ